VGPVGVGAVEVVGPVSVEAVEAVPVGALEPKLAEVETVPVEVIELEVDGVDVPFNA